MAAESGSSNVAASIYFVEEQDEVDRKGYEERQETEVVEVPGQIVLWKQTIFCFLHIFILSLTALDIYG